MQGELQDGEGRAPSRPRADGMDPARTEPGPPARRKSFQWLEKMFPMVGKFSGAAGSRTSGSSVTLFQKVSRHFRRCGILPRPNKWRAGGTREVGGRESTRTGRKPLRGRERAWKADGVGQPEQLQPFEREGRASSRPYENAEKPARTKPGPPCSRPVFLYSPCSGGNDTPTRK